MRFGWPGTESQRHLATVALPVLIATRYLAFIPFGLYRSIWRYAGSRDLASIAGAVVVSEAVSLGYVAATHSFGDFSRSFFIIDALFCAAAISRLTARRARRDRRHAHVCATAPADGRSSSAPAAPAAASCASSARPAASACSASSTTTRASGDAACTARRCSERTHEIAAIIERTAPDIVLVTIPDAPRERLNAIVAACDAAGVACRFVRRETDLDPRVILGASAE